LAALFKKPVVRISHGFRSIRELSGDLPSSGVFMGWSPLLRVRVKLCLKKKILQITVYDYNENFSAFSENYIAKLVSREKDGFVENWTKWRIFLGECEGLSAGLRFFFLVPITDILIDEILCPTIGSPIVFFSLMVLQSSIRCPKKEDSIIDIPTKVLQ
jgi:hypothetical protein